MDIKWHMVKYIVYYQLSFSGFYHIDSSCVIYYTINGYFSLFISYIFNYSLFFTIPEAPYRNLFLFWDLVFRTEMQAFFCLSSSKGTFPHLWTNFSLSAIINGEKGYELYRALCNFVYILIISELIFRIKPGENSYHP